MTEKIKKLKQEIETGKRTSIFGINLTLEEYLAKIDSETTFLEYLLKKGIYIFEKDVLKNSLDAALIYLKLNKRLWSFNFSEEQLFSKVNGKKLIELLMEKRELKLDHVKNVKNNIEIVELLISNSNFFYLSQISPEIIEKLMSPNSDGQYPIEKYLNEEFEMIFLIPLINKPKEIIELCKKNKKESLLKSVNSDVLMYKIDENKTLLEDLISKNQIPAELENIPPDLKFVNILREKELYEYLKKSNEEVLLLEIEPSKTLLEELIEKNKIEKINDFIKTPTIINILNKHNKLNLIVKTQEQILLTPANELIKDKNIINDKTFLEYMLENNYNPLLEIKEIYNDKILKIICEKGYCQCLNEKILTEQQLLMTLSDGTQAIDKILDNNININLGDSGLKNSNIAKKIYDKERIDLLIKSNLDILLQSPNEETTYLDYILENIKAKKIKYNLNYISTASSSVNTIAKFYLTLAKHSMIEYVKDLSEDELLKDYNGKTLLEELLDLNSELTIKEVLPNKVKSNMKIAVILKSRNLVQKSIDIPLEKSNLTEEYLDGIKDTYGIGPLLNEGELLLNRLYELFSQDGKSDSTLILGLISGYRQALFTNYELSIQELRNLVEVKQNNLETFIYCKNDKKGSYFSPRTGSVYCDRPVISTIIHETGHALHSYLVDMQIPDDYQSVITKTQNNPKIIKKVEEYANKYNAIKSKLKIIAEKKYQDFFKSYFDTTKTKEIDEFIQKSQIEKKDEFKLLGLSEEDLDVILKSIFTKDEYINQQKRIYINNFTEDMFRSEFGELMAISDILDAIYEGELFSGTLKNSNGEYIKRTAGHGISYYSYETNGFDEMLANFSMIIKGKDSENMLNLLKSIVGDELYNMLNEFYYNNIIKSNSEQLKIGRNL